MVIRAYKMLAAAAACDRHLPNYLREMIPDNKTDYIRITNVATPDNRWYCGCNVPAHWYVRIVSVPKDVKYEDHGTGNQ